MIYAVIPTGSRPSEYQSVYDWCIKNNIKPITVATSPAAIGYAKRQVLAGEGLNISRWWNVGLNYIYSQGDAEIILVLNDDVTIPDSWLDQMIEAIQAGYTGASGERPIGKIQGYAFALNAKQHVLADERLVWWYGDDDIQRQCEKLGGFAVVPGIDVPNKYANSSYSRFEAQIQLDRAYYEGKWA